MRATQFARILLDENLGHRLRRHLGSHDVFTASIQDWNDLNNGKQPSLTGRRLAIVALSSVEWRIIENHLAVIVRAVDSAIPGSFQAADCGRFRRTKPREE